MKAITICQPYAHLIVTGEKRVENRTWPTNYRGPLAIHAGKSRNWLELDQTGTYDDGYGIPLADMAFGAVVGTADLIACLPIHLIRGADRPILVVHQTQTYDLSWLWKHQHVEGPYCFVLANVRRLHDPIPWKGAQGFFEIPDSVIGCVHS